MDVIYLSAAIIVSWFSKTDDMYLTHSFVAIKKGSLDYLFFYLTEDYIEEQVNLRKQQLYEKKSAPNN